jgi:REP element-mobilizing transposase RayT
MARPLRIEFPGAVYHVTSRGERQAPIFADDEDRAAFLSVVAQGMARFDAQILAYVLMEDHFHFVLFTRKANLSALMRHVNGVYTQAFNRRHAKTGHLLQGRFKGVLVDRENYLLDACRYVETNPVRCGLVKEAGDWPWSSYRAHAGQAEVPAWLDADGLHAFVLGKPLAGAADRRKAAAKYATLVAKAGDLWLWKKGLNRQIYLGDDAFVAQMQKQVATGARKAGGKSATLKQLLKSCATREEALFRGFTEAGLSMTAMAEELDLSVARVSQLIGRHERSAPGA